MIRQQVYLTEDQVRDIKLRAKRERKHQAEIIRELLSVGLKTVKRQQQESAGDALLRLANVGEKLGATGPADLSTRIDDYLYGEDA